MEAKLGESEEIDSLKTGFYGFCDHDLQEKEKIKEKEKSDDNFISLRSLREVSLKLGMEVSDEELKEMMIEANQDLKNQNQENKNLDDDEYYKISKKQFEELLDRIKSGS